MVRIPNQIRKLTDEWGGYWAAVRIQSDGLSIDHYDNGEARAVYTGSDGDYYLWSVHRQQRLRNFRTAREMWAHAEESLQNGPDRFGLVQLA